MLYVQKAFEIKDQLKAIGGKYDGSMKAWAFEDHKLDEVKPLVVAPAKLVQVKPAPATTVAPAPGESFTFESFISTSGTTTVKTVCAMTSRGAIAIWSRTDRLAPRSGGTYYNRHRMAKGDNFDCETTFAATGEADAVLAATVGQLPPVFAAAHWSAPQKATTNDGPHGYPVFLFLSGLAPDEHCWFGNTDKKVIAALKKAKKTGLSFKF